MKATKRSMDNDVEVINVVYCRKEMRGDGTDFDPIRVIQQIYHPDGDLLMEHDHLREFTRKDLKEFSEYVLEYNRNEANATMSFYDLYIEWLMKRNRERQ